MIHVLWRLSVRIRIFFRRYMPTNILLDLIRTRRGLKWGIPAMGIGVLYLFLGRWCFRLVEDGALESLYLPMLLYIWNGFKFLLIGPVSVIALAQARLSEAAARRQTARIIGVEPQQMRAQ